MIDAADAWRYLAMAWREPIAPEEEPNPVAELLRPRTWADAWREFADEQAENGAELPEYASDFNLNNSNTLECK
jgi:hypothetical protein